MSDTFVDKCIELLKKEEVKKEIKSFLRPIFDIIFQEFYPYLHLCLLFILISFLLILGIFTILLRSRNSTLKIS
jgi:hypothetical protein